MTRNIWTYPGNSYWLDRG